MSDSNSNSNPSSSGPGIRLPPISFLGNLNNPRPSPPPPSSNASSQQQQQQQLTSSQMELNSSSQTINSLDNGKHTTGGANPSGYQLPPLSDSGFAQQTRISTMDGSIKQETEDKRSIYSLPTPVQLGIDVRRQNLSTPTTEQVPSDPIMEEKKLKEEKKRRNKEKRDREKLLRQQQQMLYDQQQDLERRGVIEENERLHRLNEESMFTNSNANENLATIIPPPITNHQLYHHKKLSYDDTQEEVAPFKRQNTTINNSSVLEDAEIFPRRHIGTILYQQFPTKSTVIRKLRLSKDHEKRLQEDEIEYKLYVSKNKNYLKNKPSKIINLLPPYLKFYINCLVDIKIPYKDIIKNENVFKRSLWGTDIYTDDSDIVSILYHCGIIQSKSPFANSNHSSNDEDDEDEQAHIRTATTNDPVISTTPGNKLNNKSIQYLHPTDDESHPTDEGDLIVTLIILPTLTNYQGSFRNNYNSRSWLSHHDGGSIAIYNVKWCHIDDSYKDNNYADIKKTALTDVALLRFQMEQDLQDPTNFNQDDNVEKDVQLDAQERLLKGWTFDKSYFKNTKPDTGIQQKQEQEPVVAANANETTILLNQTTQLQNLDDTTIQDITKLDDTTIDDR